jgi:hypothetical protein
MTFNVETHESWQEWVMLTQAEATNTCMSCDGDGHHGFEEETGCLYICYGCGGTGKHYHYRRAA